MHAFRMLWALGLAIALLAPSGADSGSGAYGERTYAFVKKQMGDVYRVEPPAVEVRQDAGLGRIVCPETGCAYQLTPEDALWAARMLVGEAGGRDDADNAAVLWCMVQSYALRPVRDRYPSFTAFVRAYCTPLQPYLKAAGAIARHQKRGTPMVELEPGKWQLERHVALQQRPWEKLPAGARTVVERVFSGQQASPIGLATQFCSTAIYFRDRHDRRPTPEEHAEFTRAFAKEKGWIWVEETEADPLRNVFFEEKRFAKLPRPAVRIVVRSDEER